MMKLSDYVIEKLVDFGIQHIFMVSGGGAMHLNDSVGKNKKIEYICNHHEQASAIAAEGYVRSSKRLCAVIVTTGPGGTNTLTGVAGQYFDSVPAIYISGQVKKETIVSSYPDLDTRQIGDQEINITEIVKPLTKYAEMVRDPERIRWYLEKAYHEATSGRPGPVWLDIPLDVQAAQINEEKLAGYVPEKKELFNREAVKKQVSEIADLLEKAKRPVFVAGNGIRIANAERIYREIVELLGIPVLLTFNGLDLIESNHPLSVGGIGTVGTRAGNFALQNSDLMLSVGSRNNIRQVSYNWKGYARAAIKVVVDIDRAELEKPTHGADIPVHSDAGYFLEELLAEVRKRKLQSPQYREWVRWCAERKNRYPVVLPEYDAIKDRVNPYYFVKALTECMESNAIAVAGNGTACVSLFQAAVVKRGCRLELWMRLHGIRPPCINRGMHRERKKRRHMPGWRREPADEHTGTADSKTLQPPDKTFRPRQQRIHINQADTGLVFQGTLRRIRRKLGSQFT
jgi:acetolactate synthase-1/2/3 large subunit